MIYFECSFELNCLIITIFEFDNLDWVIIDKSKLSLISNILMIQNEYCSQHNQRYVVFDLWSNNMLWKSWLLSASQFGLNTYPISEVFCNLNNFEMLNNQCQDCCDNMSKSNGEIWKITYRFSSTLNEKKFESGKTCKPIYNKLNIDKDTEYI